MRLAVSPEEAAGPFLERAAPGVPGPLFRGPLSAHARGARGVLHSERRGYDTPQCSCREHALHVGSTEPGIESTKLACAVPADLEPTRPSNGALVGPIEVPKERGTPMKLKNITALLAALLFAFAVVACDNDDDDATEAPAASPVASEAAE